jgi:phosphomannomutase
MSTSRVIQDIAARYGCRFERSAVGEANVVAKIREVGAIIGGEGNGGVIDPRVGWVRDPYVGMAMILNLMAMTGHELSHLIDSLPSYHMLKTKYAIPPDQLTEGLPRLRQRWPEAQATSLDGLRLDWPDRWLHVRGSNTEPVVRIIAEAPTRDEAEKLCAQACSELRIEN